MRRARIAQLYEHDNQENERNLDFTNLSEIPSQLPKKFESLKTSDPKPKQRVTTKLERAYVKQYDQGVSSRALNT